MNTAKSTGVLLLAVVWSCLFSAEGAKPCETQLLQGCISQYRRILKGKPSPGYHCTRVQVSRIAKSEAFVSC